MVGNHNTFAIKLGLLQQCKYIRTKIGFGSRLRENRVVEIFCRQVWSVVVTAKPIFLFWFDQLVEFCGYISKGSSRQFRGTSFEAIPLPPPGVRSPLNLQRLWFKSRLRCQSRYCFERYIESDFVNFWVPYVLLRSDFDSKGQSQCPL